MSVRHLALVADITAPSPTCKLVLFVLALNASAQGWTPIGNKPVRNATGLSERAVRDAMTKLKAAGYIEATSGSLGKLKLS